MSPTLRAGFHAGYRNFCFFALSSRFLLTQVYLVGGQKGEEKIVPNIVKLQFCCQEDT